MSINSADQPFWDHVEDLRKVAIKIFCVIFFGFLGALYFSDNIVAIAKQPLKSIQTSSSALLVNEVKTLQIDNTSQTTQYYELPSQATWIKKDPAIAQNQYGKLEIPPQTTTFIQTKQPQNELAIFSPVEGITTLFKICFWISLTLTSPIWLLVLLRFILPALRANEKMIVFPFLALSAVFFSFGLFFAFYITIPLANTFLWSFNSTLGMNLWSFSDYFNFTLFLFLANGLGFELALVLLMLVHIGIISTETLSTYRRHAIVGILILAALLTPPDVPSQLMLALPLWGFYELAILYGKLKNKKLPQSPQTRL